MKNSNLNDALKFLIEMDVRAGKMFSLSGIFFCYFEKFSTACCVENS